MYVSSIKNKATEISSRPLSPKQMHSFEVDRSYEPKYFCKQLISKFLSLKDSPISMSCKYIITHSVIHNVINL